MEIPFDDSGWLDSNEVTNVTIDNRVNYKQGSYVNQDVSVVIKYSSAGRVYVKDLLKDWKNTDYQTIEAALKSAGLSEMHAACLYGGSSHEMICRVAWLGTGMRFIGRRL